MSKNKFTSALLILSIGLNGCAMIQPAAMSGPCRDAATGRYTSCDTGPSGWDRLSSDDRLALGLTAGVALAGLVAWGIYEMVSGPSRASSPPPPYIGVNTFESPSPPSLRGVTVCMASNGHTLRFSANFDCVANGYTRPPSIDDRTLDAQRREQAINDSFDAPTVQTTTGGPVYVHGYTRANGTYVAPHTRRR